MSAASEASRVWFGGAQYRRGAARRASWLRVAELEAWEPLAPAASGDNDADAEAIARGALGMDAEA